MVSLLGMVNMVLVGTWYVGTIHCRHTIMEPCYRTRTEEPQESKHHLGTYIGSIIVITTDDDDYDDDDDEDEQDEDE